MPTIFWIVEDGELICYKRNGECKQCGKCCCTHKITYGMETNFPRNRDEYENKEEVNWSEREGYSMFKAQGIWWYFYEVSIEENTTRDTICEKYDADAKSCTIFGDMETFPPICRYWPFHPSNTEQFPECGFRFERVEEA